MAITLKAARVNANLTQMEVAERLKISKTTLTNYEKYRTIPSIAMAQKFAELYGLEVDDIIFLPEDCA
jgi:transcriptional regulator with XRE-family HTH domain